ncbi:MAG TPA: IS1634 family transposase [Roseiarcus sp.]|jgi:Transposase DDE domain|nr:IS1634 family transposase [Roseiarcus sp.]
MYFRRKTSAGRAYLQIVESRREGAAVRQQVIATLGRIEDLQESGQLERLLRSGARFADKAIVLDALDRGEATVVSTRRIGPALAFERVWEETGCRGVIERLASKRGHEFSLERAAFLTMLHRLFGGGSDRAADRWREDYRIDGVEGLELHHLYRAMAWLGEELPENEQDGATPFARRCVKDVLEEELFACRRDLLTTLDVVFMDTTSLYFEGAGGQTLGQRGFSKDHRPDLNQMILAVLLDGDGRPVCTEMWPGNTADVGSLIPAIDRLQRRFRINRVCVVADRGMISAETIAELEARRLLYVLGVRERTDKLVRELALDDPAPFVPYVLMKRGDEVDYEAKAVALAGRRYIVCRNLDQMKKDAADRAAIVAALERQLQNGVKSLVGNKGFRRFLANPQGDGFSIDRAKVVEDAKFDGVFVLRTNASLSPLEAMLVYKQLWTVERAFRTTKSLFETRPIYHKLDETIRGHVACSFLALVLKKELEDRLAAANNGARASWPDVIADLDSLTETEVEQDAKRFLLRSAPRPAASLALSALGVALPPTLRQITGA